MANCMMAYPDRTLGTTAAPTTIATVAGTTWSTTLTLDNLKNKLRTKVARTSTASLATAQKFDITYTTATTIQMLAILNHNMTQNATVTLSFSNVALGGYELGQALNVPVWPTWFPSETPSGWANESYWSGITSPDFWHVLATKIVAKYIRVEITDTANAAGYIELGRCFTANVLQPEINMDYGADMKWVQNADKVSSLGDVDWFNIKSNKREIAFTLGTMSIAEGMVMVFDQQRRLGLEGELFFIFDPDDTCGLYKSRAMLCRMGAVDALKYPFFDRTSASYQLTEVV